MGGVQLEPPESAHPAPVPAKLKPPDPPAVCAAAPTSASVSSITRKQSPKIMELGREDGGQ